jgi:hypothetical protein
MGQRGFPETSVTNYLYSLHSTQKSAVLLILVLVVWLTGTYLLPLSLGPYFITLICSILYFYFYF